MLKFMVLLLIAAFVGLFFVKGPDGERMLTLDDFKPDVPALATEAESTAPTKVYKWQDENGVWQFSNQPQDEALGETVEYDGKINTMPAVDSASSGSRPGERPSLVIPSGLTTVSGEQAADMMETVNHLQQTVDERKAQLDAMSGTP